MDLIALCRQAWQRVFGDQGEPETVRELPSSAELSPAELSPPSHELMAELEAELPPIEKPKPKAVKKPVKRPAAKKPAKPATKKSAKKR